MKQILAISNLVGASILSLFLMLSLVFVHEPIAGTENLGIIGGSDEPTAIFLSSEPSIPALIFIVVITGLLYINAYEMWKNRKYQQSPGTDK